ncbi:RagB/SusD family nutrient uptake outer membrane protein [Sphingobacterium spiritivorum]|uniref:SusD family protein n=1 Tax=Sphingobacterium spiritivorum ATCC 33861 TaxID=525373 RepID=D7VP10_SPHSI|nr:RagB/SusD family nutrient uptake outer membrane protein [Sphingobacterium spiritivorum]EFK57657.1 SusD family protein [Sphingobacterium spiritivorum ATCC 33861]QQT36300.1 RagB/SusD family nutrient uptake outer membrane protein [Sphingobacterium spiritivorum]WQD33040.1 RagB/SusD family nutrient uptake outer membrane protein [Sphingobacterium spiritivorum]SUJ18557.1 SusD family [Sphingobacterium spiritivorum]
MKKILISLVIGAAALTSCNKFLEILPTSTVAPQNFFRNEAEAEMALTGVYDILAKSGTYGRTIYFELDIADDSFVALSSWTQDLALFNYNPSDTKVTDLWNYLYTGINRANTLLDNIDRVDMDATKRKAIEGQALFLRAYYYFILTNYWGNIPVRTTATSSVTDNDLEFTPYSEVYKMIVADMEKAADMVNPASAYGHAGRVTKQTVWGILARVNLKMGGAPLHDQSRYAEAKKWAEKVILGGGNALNPDFREVFKNMSKGTYDVKESMWEVEFNRYNGTQNEEGSLGSINGIAASATTPWGFSYGAKHAIPYYFNMFENYPMTINGVSQILSPDMRRDWTIGSYYYSGNLKAGYNGTQIYNRMDAKWRREYEPTDPKFNGTTTINFPLLRYSDVLLMYAEADNELNGPQSQAIEYVNQVRRRAYGKTLGNGVYYVTVDNGGTGYTQEPQVSIVGGGGYDAEARAVISAGKVTSIMLLNPGQGFTSVPNVIIAGNGTGATATATLDPRATVNADLKTNETLDKVAFRLAVRRERALELGYEGLRRFDLVRWGDYISTMKNVAVHIKSTATGTSATYAYASRHGDNISPRDTLLAVPSREIQMNKKAKQNNGW